MSAFAQGDFTARVTEPSSDILGTARPLPQAQDHPCGVGSVVAPTVTQFRNAASRGTQL